MKIIDLLNKIANGEEVPKKIKIKDEIWIYDEIDYRASDDRGYLFEVHTRTNCQDLNEEIEILEEEKKIPEKLKDILRVDDLIPPVDENMYKIWQQTIKNQNKINSIIDYLKSKGE